MAIPTITSVTPNNGEAYGNYIVSVTGTNFRLPALVPDEHKQESVRVYLGGIQVDPELVYVRTTDLFEFRVPETLVDSSLIPYTVDLYIENIDASGLPIPTENATLANAFTYTYIDLNNDKPIVSATRQLKRYLERNMGIGVFLSTDIDYKTNTSSFNDQAPTEGLLITTNTLSKNIVPLCCLQGKYDKYYTILTLPRSYDLLYTIIGYAKSRLRLERIMESFEQVIRLSMYFDIPWNYGVIKTQLFFDSLPNMDGLVIEMSDVYQFTSIVRMSGVPMLSENREISYTIDDIHFL